MRLFVLPATAETTDAVIGDMKRGQIGNFNVLRWRLNMALQPSTAAGVRLADTWKYWNSAQVDKRFLTDDLGWPIETLHVIDAYGYQTIIYRKFNILVPVYIEMGTLRVR